MAGDKVITPPTPPAKEKQPSDLWTTTTPTATTGDKWLTLAAWLCIVTWAAAGVLIGVILLGAAELWLQLTAAGSWLVFSLLGWLPWQMVDR